jgi:hypothetical protein
VRAFARAGLAERPRQTQTRETQTARIKQVVRMQCIREVQIVRKVRNAKHNPNRPKTSTERRVQTA